MAQKHEELGNKLLRRQIKPSYQRVRILEYLIDNHNHPTVEHMFKALQRELPTLSKTTIYNTLNLFVDAKLVRLITTGDNEARYDIVVDNHGHFKCEKCGNVYDFDININNFVSNELNDFIIKDKSVYFKGICPRCL